MNLSVNVSGRGVCRVLEINWIDETADVMTRNFARLTVPFSSMYGFTAEIAHVLQCA